MSREVCEHGNLADGPCPECSKDVHRLAASAPDLLTACKLTLGLMQHGGMWWESFKGEVYRKLEAAIKKAEGK